MIKNVGTLLTVALAVAGCQQEPKYPGALQGIVELDEIDLGFEVGGRLTKLTVDEGSRVEAGAVIAALDDSVQQKVHTARMFEADAADAQVALFEAGPRAEELRAARARLSAAKANEKHLAGLLERHRSLEGGPGASPKSVVDEIDARHKAAVAERSAIQQEYSALRAGVRSQELDGAVARAAAARAAADVEAERLTRYELSAAAAGTVVRVVVERGEIVRPGVPIVTLIDPGHPYADVFVPQADIAGVAPGTVAEVHVDSLDEPVAGSVEYVERRTEFTPRFIFSEAERPNLMIRVRVRIDDPNQQLSAGVPAFVYLK